MAASSPTAVNNPRVASDGETTVRDDTATTHAGDDAANVGGGGRAYGVAVVMAVAARTLMAMMWVSVAVRPIARVFT